MGGLFNPQSFLTAIMQQTARKNDWPLDKMELNCDVTKKNKEDFNAPPREGRVVKTYNWKVSQWLRSQSSFKYSGPFSGGGGHYSNIKMQTLK